MRKKMSDNNEVTINDIVTTSTNDNEVTILVDTEGLKKHVDTIFNYSERYGKYYAGFEKVRVDNEYYTIDIKISLNKSQYNLCKGISTPTSDVASILNDISPEKMAMIQAILNGGNVATTTKKRTTRKKV